MDEHKPPPQSTPVPPDLPPGVLTARPVTEAQRLDALDTIRGFALLGIFVMNVRSFGNFLNAYLAPFMYYGGANVEGAYLDPSLRLGAWNINEAILAVTEILVSGKMLGLFSTLFGAGVFIFMSRAGERGHNETGLHVRRMLWLLVFGVLHGVFLWTGDILAGYAVGGLAVFGMRKIDPRVQLFIVLSLTMVDGAIMAAVFAEDGGVAMGLDRREWEAYTGSYWEQTAHRLESTLYNLSSLPFMLPGTIGLMLLGMVLLRLRCFHGEWTLRAYLLMGVAGTLSGGAIAYFRIFPMLHYGAQSENVLGNFLYPFEVLLMVLGYCGLWMAVVQSGTIPGICRVLGNVGRTALSNYLLQTAIGTTIFYGHGFGHYARLSLLEMTLIVPVVWIVCLLWSTIWLRFFRYGPAEYLWRSLTYGFRGLARPR